MHILFLTDNFPPEVNAPASRTFEHCRSWAKAGHELTVITCVPNFPRGKVYKGYKNRLWQSEDMSGIRVIRVWSYITANEGFLKRTLDYMSFMVAGFLASLFVRKVDVVVGTSPQFFTVCATYVSSIFKHVPFVFELRDLWPESIKAVGAMKSDSFVMRMLERLEYFLYRKAVRIVSVTESFKRILVDRGISPEKIDVVTNGVDLSRYIPRERDQELLRRFGLVDRFVVGYVGTHGMAHGLETILRAAARVQQKDDGKTIHFVLLGDGAAKRTLMEKASAMALRNITFIDSVSKDEVARYWSLLDLAVIHLKNTPLFTTVIPSKLFESMAMGKPVLHGVPGESAEIVEKEGVGIVFEPENDDILIESIYRFVEDPDLYRRMSVQCRVAAERYDRDELADHMLGILEGIHQNARLAVSTER